MKSVARYTIDNGAGPIETECRDRERRILQNAKNLLRCRMGEVPYDRMRGIDPAIFDLPMNQVREVLLPEIQRVLAWEPRVTVRAAKAEMLAGGEMRMTAEVEIIG